MSEVRGYQDHSAMLLDRRAKRIAAGHHDKCGLCEAQLTAADPGIGLRPGVIACDCCRDKYYPYDENHEWQHRTNPCAWCDTPMLSYHYPSKSRTCSKYCSIRRAKHGGNGGSYWHSDLKRNEVDPKTSCLSCGTEFLPQRKSAKYCSNPCRVAYGRATTLYRVHRVIGDDNSHRWPIPGYEATSLAWRKVEIAAAEFERLKQHFTESYTLRDYTLKLEEVDKAGTVLQVLEELAYSVPVVEEEPVKVEQDLDEVLAVKVPMPYRTLLSLRRLSAHMDKDDDAILWDLIAAAEKEVIDQMTSEEHSAYCDRVTSV